MMHIMYKLQSQFPEPIGHMRENPHLKGEQQSQSVNRCHIDVEF